MEIGIGLPSAIPGVGRQLLLDWARRAEQRGFSSLGVFDRLVYDSIEPLTLLAAAGAVTSRIKLTTYVLLPVPRGNTVRLAKQIATVARLSGDRLVLGVGLGGHEDDYRVSGVPMSGRGRRLDGMLDEMRRIWAGEDVDGSGPVGPLPGNGGPRILIGGDSEAAFARAARHSGWVGGNAGPEHFAEVAGQIRAAWREAGREGEPRLQFAQYFALGGNAAERAGDYVRSWYHALPEPVVESLVGLAVTDTEQLRERVAAFETAGLDELILFPTSADLRQVDLLADALDLPGEQDAARRVADSWLNIA